MNKWYYKVCKDLGALPDFVDFFEAEYLVAKSELSMKGLSLEKIAADMPGIVEHRYNQLQEIESVLEHLNLKKVKKKSERFRHYLEGHKRALTSRDAEKYAEGDKEYYDICVLVNEVALLRNKFLGIHKGLDQKSWMISHVVRLKAAGLDDAHL